MSEQPGTVRRLVFGPPAANDYQFEPHLRQRRENAGKQLATMLRAPKARSALRRVQLACPRDAQLVETYGLPGGMTVFWAVQIEQLVGRDADSGETVKVKTRRRDHIDTLDLPCSTLSIDTPPVEVDWIPAACRCHGIYKVDREYLVELTRRHAGRCTIDADYTALSWRHTPGA